MPMPTYGTYRWLALIVLCLGALMIVLDGTVVNVALPYIRADLGFTQASLVWPVNAYVLAFGGFLLLGGRLGDLYGARRLFLIGIVEFTLASLICGLATSRAMLIWARAAQGLGAAVVDAVSLSLLMTIFMEPRERTKALGVYGFVTSAGGVFGILVGGPIISSLGWHWIFFVNLPVGVLVYLLCYWLVPPTLRDVSIKSGRLDILGAITVTLSMVTAVYAIVNTGEGGWVSRQFAVTLSVAVMLMGLFFVIESRVQNPLVPLELFRSRSLTVANIVSMLWSGAGFAWYFFTALYLQRVLGCDAMQVSMAFLPANLLVAVLSLGVSARLVSRFGAKRPLIVGLLLSAIGLAWLSGVPVTVKGSVWASTLPAMMLLAVGSGIAANPLMIAAMHGVASKDCGLASGLFNTSIMMGGALGLAILASAAAAWTTMLSHSGMDLMAALTDGYHVAFAGGALFAFVASALSAALLPSGKTELSVANERGR